MIVVSRKVGERFRLPDGLAVTILQMDCEGVRLGVCAAHGGRGAEALYGQLSDIRCNGPSYYLFPDGGSCTLVASCEKGTSVSINGTAQLTVVDVDNGSVKLQVACSSGRRRSRVSGAPACSASA